MCMCMHRPGCYFLDQMPMDIKKKIILTPWAPWSSPELDADIGCSTEQVFKCLLDLTTAPQKRQSVWVRPAEEGKWNYRAGGERCEVGRISQAECLSCSGSGMGDTEFTQVEEWGRQQWSRLGSSKGLISSSVFILRVLG